MKKIGIIGAGNMGEALIKGLGRNIIVSDISKERLGALKRRYKIKIAVSNRELARQSRIIILAVKPQNLDAVLSEIAPFIDEKKLVISIAAGVKTSHIQKRLPGKIPVVRVMPNMPALIGKAISALCPGKFAKKAHKQTAVKIFSSLGKTVEVKENLMDIVTAISGSGPAYFFFLMELLIDAGIRHGLAEETAKKLVLETAFGAASLVLKTRQDPGLLRQKVASKGGTTEAAFEVFQQAGLTDIFSRAIDAAIERSKEISCS